jgi:hypothetical protein
MKRERFCLRKLGFTHEGTLRHRVFFRDRFWNEDDFACSRTSGRDRRPFFSPEKVCWIESKRRRRPGDNPISFRKCGSGAWCSMSKPGGGASSRLHFSERHGDTSLDQIALLGRTRQDAALLSGAVRVIGLAFPSRYGETRSHSALRMLVGGGVCA